MCVTDNDNKDGYYCKNYNGFAYKRTQIAAIGNLGPEFKIAFDLNILTFGDLEAQIIEFGQCFLIQIEATTNAAQIVLRTNDGAYSWETRDFNGIWHHVELVQAKKNDKVRDYNYEY